MSRLLVRVLLGALLVGALVGVFSAYTVPSGQAVAQPYGTYGGDSYIGGTGPSFLSLRLSSRAFASAPLQEGGADSVWVLGRGKFEAPVQLMLEVWQNDDWLVIADTAGQEAAESARVEATIDSLMANGDTLLYRGRAYDDGEIVATVLKRRIIYVPDEVAPSLTSFAATAWDSAGLGSMLRVRVVAGANEASLYRLGFGQTLLAALQRWTDNPAITGSFSDTLNAFVNTGILPFGGAVGQPLYVVGSAFDASGNSSAASNTSIIVQQTVVSPPTLDEFSWEWGSWDSPAKLLLSSSGLASYGPGTAEMGYRYQFESTWTEWSEAVGQSYGATAHADTRLFGFVQNTLVALSEMVSESDSLAVRVRLGRLDGTWGDWAEFYAKYVDPEYDGIASASAAIQYGPYNGASPLTVGVSATADTSASWTAEVEIKTDMWLSGAPVLANYEAWKTQAVGVHTFGPFVGDQLSENLVIPFRAYHGDSIIVTLTASISETDYERVVLRRKLDYPLTVASLPDTLPAASYKIGSMFLGDARYVFGAHARTDANWGPRPGAVSIADVAKSDVLVVPHSWSTARPAPWSTPETYIAYYKKLRDAPWSRNKAVLGFTDFNVLDYGTEMAMVPTKQRLYQYLTYLDTLSTNAETFGKAIARNWQGGVPDARNQTTGAIGPNFLNEVVMDSLAAFKSREWRWAESRILRVGEWFDVWESHSDQGASGNRQDNGEYSNNAWMGVILDFDGDGAAFYDDPDEQVGLRYMRASWFTKYRAALEAEHGSLFADNFIMGANSVSAKADTLLLSKLDYLHFEKVQTPRIIGTGYEVYNIDCSDANATYMPYHRMYGGDFTREYPECLYYHGASHDSLPDPEDMNSSVQALAALMRKEAGGPYLMHETIGFDINSSLSLHPVYAEVLSLFGDYTLAQWHRDPAAVGAAPGYSLRRWWNHPDDEGYPSLYDLGAATGAVVRDTLDVGGDGWIHWKRAYANGAAELLVKTEDRFVDDGPDLASVDQFEYSVYSGSTVLRRSAGWFEPAAPQVVSLHAAAVDSSAGDWVLSGDAIASTQITGAEVWYKVREDGDWSAWNGPEDVPGEGTELAYNAVVGHSTADADSFDVKLRLYNSFGYGLPDSTGPFGSIRATPAVVAGYSASGLEYDLAGPDSTVRVLFDGVSNPASEFSLAWAVGNHRDSTGSLSDFILADGATDTLSGLWETSLANGAALAALGDSLFGYVYVGDTVEATGAALIDEEEEDNVLTTLGILYAGSSTSRKLHLAIYNSTRNLLANTGEITTTSGQGPAEGAVVGPAITAGTYYLVLRLPIGHADTFYCSGSSGARSTSGTSFPDSLLAGSSASRGRVSIYGKNASGDVIIGDNNTSNFTTATNHTQGTLHWFSSGTEVE